MESNKPPECKYKTVLALSLFALAAVLLPLFILGHYTVPCGDDYSYGAAAHAAFRDTGMLRSVLSAAIRQTADTYYSWQGTYSAAFIMALQPAVFGEQFYWVTTYLMLLSLCSGIFALTRAVFTDAFGVSRALSAIVAVACCFLCTQLLPSATEAFFWFNGSVYYTFFFGLSLLAIALGINFSVRAGAWRIAVLCALGAVLGGVNYVTALTCAIVGVGGVAWLAVQRNPRWRVLIIPVLIFLAAFLFSVTAPGNQARQAMFTERAGVLGSILLSFKEGAVRAVEWTTLPVIALLILLSPMLFASAAASDARFRFPIVVSALSYCLFSAMFCPPIYAMNDSNTLRLLNIIYYAHVLLLVFNLFYWLGWFAKKRGKAAHGVAADSVSMRSFLVATLLCVALCGASVVRGTSYTSLRALNTLRSGEAAAFRDSANQRYVVLNDASVKDAVISGYACTPDLLFILDIPANPDNYLYKDMCSYYEKNSITVKLD